jgi:hypothetical protein
VDSAAPFRLEVCRVAGHELPLVLDAPAVLSPIEGGLAADGTPWPVGPHWLLDPGETLLSGHGATLLAAWR